MPSSKLTLKDKKTLLTTARHAIQYGLTYAKSPKLELEKYTPVLLEKGASFVTLTESNQLRGCIGTLEAYQPLIQDVADHAYAAAFKDPRFPPVKHIEEPLLHISISILSPAVPIDFNSEQDLISQLIPGEDGLILEYQNNKGTFLPSVWQQLKSPQTFLNHLKAKAGLNEDFWDEEIKVSRYTCVSID